MVWCYSCNQETEGNIIPRGDIQCQNCRGFFVVVDIPDEEERPRQGRPRTPSECIQHCPTRHQLQIVQLGPDSRWCDGCQQELYPGSLVKQCEPCNYDLCGQCENGMRDANAAVDPNQELINSFGSIFHALLDVVQDGATMRSADRAPVISPYQEALENRFDAIEAMPGFQNNRRFLMDVRSMRENIANAVRALMEQNFGTAELNSGANDEQIQAYLEAAKIDVAKENLMGEAGSEWCCSICTEVAESDSVIVKICESHYFHLQCVAEWLKRKNSCPLCRREPLIEVGENVSPTPPC